MGLRKVRSEATSLRKEGVSLNGSEKVMIVRRVFFITVSGLFLSYIVLLLGEGP